MRADIRSGADAKTRRTQPNWMLECVKAGIPLSQLPPTPAADASFGDKSRHTWALRKAWETQTGRQIERLTPSGYSDKLTEKRRAARKAMMGSSPVVRQVIAEPAKQVDDQRPLSSGTSYAPS